MAVRGHEPPVIVELKIGFSLTLLHQAIERQSITDSVYIAVPRGKGKPFQASLKRNVAICRRLGLGLLTVRAKDSFVEAHLDPGPYAPRISKIKNQRLLREFTRRVGDPMAGGSAKARPMLTAYRQDALRCVVCLRSAGPTKASLVAQSTGVERARMIMSADHYGWFERVDRGIYRLTPKGEAALEEFADAVAALREGTT
ncbi:MAG: DUF2161 family putative PD-(D/E)XK-type phosphodiesterase [Pseudomonadota bacterium]